MLQAASGAPHPWVAAVGGRTSADVGGATTFMAFDWRVESFGIRATQESWNT